MFEIDKSRVNGDTTNMLLSNISEQLSELIGILRQQEVKEIKKKIKKEIKKEIKDDSFKCPKCGKQFEKQKQLQGHMIKCKGK
jgi:predicted RNA-binding Zn-ribbon protein involved in translation (DUF1610 family)